MDRATTRRHLPSLAFTAALMAVLLLAAAASVYFGAYNVAADAPHTSPVRALLDNVRNRSIAVRARAIVPPADLASPERLRAGAGLYGEMCASCHLGPGVGRSELSQGLYPPAPDLARGSRLSPAEQFWIIKHGIKLTAMPAWGKTHSDPLIWNMVAFVRRLPGMSPAEYQRLVASAPASHDVMMRDMQEKRERSDGHGHEHGGH